MFRRQRLLGIALASSLLLHALVALLMPSLSENPGLTAVQTVSFVRARRIDVVRHDLRPRRSTVAPHSVAGVTLAPQRIGHHQKSHAVEVAPRELSALVTPAAPAQTSVWGNAHAGLASSSPAPVPAVQAQSTPSSKPAAGGYMPFGADEPDPVIDPKSLAQLHALGVHVTLTVTVGDDGKTKIVNFHPPLDPQLESQVRAVLLAANWDPAYCGGGVPCQKDTDITL
ncbi:MAG TPA: hypothetical protein VIJ12_03915 [Candidatus Baltobacteraceae bacterium]